MQKKSILEFSRRIREIPTLPSVLMQVNNVLSGNSQTIEAVSGIIEKDPALTAKILKLANSSYYGLSYRVDTLKKAITVLGFNTIRNLAFTVSVFNIFNKESGTSLDLKGLWYHSLGCAIASKALLKKMDPLLQEKAFMGGILHDIGKVIICQNLPGEMKKILQVMRTNKSVRQSALEEKLLGFNHAEIGSYIAEKWHFPRELVLAINLHHSPLTVSEMNEKKEVEILVSGAYVGNQISKALALGKSSDIIVTDIVPSTWDLLNITHRELPEILFNIKTMFGDVLSSWEL